MESASRLEPAPATPERRESDRTHPWKTPSKPLPCASHPDAKTPPRVRAEDPSTDAPARPRRANSIDADALRELPEGRVCLVVGENAVADEIAARLAAEPDAAVVVRPARTEAAAAVAAERLRGSGCAVVGLGGFDPGFLRDVRRLARDVGERFGRLDVLVNAGAAAPTDGAAARTQTSEGLERGLVEAHLGPHLLATSLAPLLERAAGRVVHVSLETRDPGAWAPTRLQSLDAQGLARQLTHASAVSVAVAADAPAPWWALCAPAPPTPAGQAAVVLLATLQPVTALPSGAHVRRKGGSKKIRVAPDDAPGDVERSWAVAEQLCAA